MENRVRRSYAGAFLWAASVYSLAWVAVMLKWYRYYLNPDAVSYISIAQKYLYGDFTDALNAYWGPLYSWLLVPLLATGIEPLWAARLLGWVLGLGAFAALALLAHHLALSPAARRAVALAAIPMTLCYSMFPISPDLLLVVLLLVYVCLALSLDDPRWMRGPAIGLLGASAYLAKAYALPFFLSHLVLMAGSQTLSLRDRLLRQRIWRNTLLAFLTFGVISGLWIGLLSAKYGRLTWSTSGSFNLRIEAPKPYHQQSPHRVAPPPNRTAVSSSEDPSYIATPDWGPFRSLRDFLFYGRLVLENLCAVYRFLLSFSSLSIAIVVLGIVALLDRDVPRWRRSGFLHLLTTSLLFSFGYALVFVEIRYLWLCSFLLLLMGGSCYDHLVARGSLPGLKAAFVLVVLVVSFAYQPAHTLVAQRYTGSEEYRSAQAFAAYIPAGAKIVSSGSRGASICLAYYLKAQYYGVVKSNGNMPEMEALLRQYGIDHYLLWEETGANALVFTAYEHVPTPGIKTPTLYRRKGNVTRPNGDPKIKIRVSLIDPACPFS